MPILCIGRGSAALSSGIDLEVSSGHGRGQVCFYRYPHVSEKRVGTPTFVHFLFTGLQLARLRENLGKSEKNQQFPGESTGNSQVGKGPRIVPVGRILRTLRPCSPNLAPSSSLRWDMQWIFFFAGLCKRLALSRDASWPDFSRLESDACA